jgi:Cu+-exporting ATPase
MIESLHQPSPAQPQTVITTILIRNLHCPSCVSTINDSLYALSPKPLSVSSSIVSQTVAIQHESSLAVPTILRALGEAGFEIDSIIEDPQGDIVDGEQYHPWEHSPLRIVKSWKTIRRHQKDEDEKRAKHVEQCDKCRAEEEVG